MIRKIFGSTVGLIKMRAIKGYDAVGPVLISSEITDKVVAAIKTLNKNVEIQDRGSYIRILTPLQCKLTREAVQEQTDLPFVLPDDLELIMPSFKGILTISKDEAVWTFLKTPQDSRQ